MCYHIWVLQYTAHILHSSNEVVFVLFDCLLYINIQADLLNLFRGQGGRLGFTIERDGFVSDVLDYAVINGLQPGCRIVQVCITKQKQLEAVKNGAAKQSKINAITEFYC